MNILSLKALATKNETLVAVVIVAFCILATFSDPLFMSVTTLTDLMRASVVIGSQPSRVASPSKVRRALPLALVSCITAASAVAVSR